MTLLKDMEAIPFIPTSSSPKTQSSIKAQTSSSDSDSSFAPILSKAVADSKNTNGATSAKSTTFHHHNKTAGSTSKNSSRSQTSHTTDTKNGSTTISSTKDTSKAPKQNQDTSSTTKETTQTSKAKDASGNDSKSKTLKPKDFMLGLLGYLFSIQKNISAQNLNKEAETLSIKFGIGKQESLNLLKNIATLGKSASFGSQIMKMLASDPQQDAKLQKIIDGLSSNDTPSNLQANLDKLLQTISQETDTTQSQSTLRAADSTTGSSPLSSLAQDLQKTSQNTQATTSQNTQITTSQNAQPLDKQSLVAQQLQKILNSDSGRTPLKIHIQSGQQNQADGLNSLSSPFLKITENQDNTAIANSLAVGDTAVAASLTKLSSPEGNSKTNTPFRLDENHDHIPFIKNEIQDQKDTTTIKEEDTNLQNAVDHRQNDSSSATNTSSTTLQTGQFGFGSALTQSLQASQNTAQPMAPTHFTSWTSVQENAIINQVMQRFHINANSPSSKIVVKLYPEELGELKIDVQMKDGALKANIVTQTQQAQQVLEKYIPKLKSYMEQQGLTVDDILVTNTSDDVGGHDLFQEDFVDNNDFTPPGKSFRTASFPDSTFDNVFSENNEGIPGVNVTV